MLKLEDRIRSEIYISPTGNKQNGHIYNCKNCGNEIFKTPYYAKKSTGYCANCINKIIHIKPKLELKTKICNLCERELDIKKFSCTGSGHYKSSCTQCTNLKAIFNISYDEYYKLLESQDFKCAICVNPETSLRHSNKNLSIDHCHETGKIRGLLCTNCNLSLGGFKDSIDNLLKAIEYLKTNSY